MFLRNLVIAGLLLAGGVPGWAQDAPHPPQYLLDKQLPGEDPYAIQRVVFSPDGVHVAGMLSNPPVLTVWDVKTGKVAAQVPASVHGVDALDGLEFTKDSEQLLLLRKDLPLKYVDWRQGKVVREIPLQADPKKILSYAFNPDKSQLAVGTYQGIAVWDLKAGKKVADYLKGQAISGLDIAYHKTSQGKVVHTLAYGRLLQATPKYQNLAGLLDLDSGKTTPLVQDLPADKKGKGETYIMVGFEGGAGHLMVSYFCLPPQVKAGAVLVDTASGKALANHQLGQTTVELGSPRYLGRPYNGFVLATADSSKADQPEREAVQFLAPSQDKLAVLETLDEKAFAASCLVFSRDNSQAAVVVKKDAKDKARLFIYKVLPKKR